MKTGNTAQTGRPESSQPFSAGPILIFSSILLCNVLSRTVFAPLLVSIEADLGISHAQGGRLFFFIAVGYSASMLLSGFVSARLRHRRTIAVAVFAASASMIAIALARTYGGIAAGLVLLGASNGLYIPSGIASVYAIAPRAHWGKAISVHEIGPSIGLVIGPVLAEAAARFTTWRVVVAGIGIVISVVGVLFLILRVGSESRGAPPVFANVSELLKMRTFWISVVFFWLAAAVAMGLYSVLPVYLVAERGVSQTAVNTVISGSRVAGVLVTAGFGVLVDRFGTMKLLIVYWVITAAVTIFLGLAPGTLALVATALVVCAMGGVFPGSYAAASRIEDPKLHNVALSIVLPAGYFLWAGLLPAVLGTLGEAGLFWAGYLGVGITAAVVVALVAVLNRPLRY